MKTTGIVRKIDDLGRIVIPIELRKTLGLSVRDDIEIIAEEELTRDLPLVMYSSKTNLGRVDLWNQIYSACEV